MTTQFQVFMHTKLADQLDNCLSPLDGIQAIGDVHVGLPRVHQPRRLTRLFQHCLPLYHARLEWIGLGISYVQLGNQLHVVQVWEESDRENVTRSAIVIPQCDDAIQLTSERQDEEDANACL